MGGHSLYRHRASLEEITRGAAVARQAWSPTVLLDLLGTWHHRRERFPLWWPVLGSAWQYGADWPPLGVRDVSVGARPTGAILTCREEPRSVRGNNTPDLRQSTALSRSTRRAHGLGGACQTAGGACWSPVPCHPPSVPAACEPTPARLSRKSDSPLPFRTLTLGYFASADGHPEARRTRGDSAAAMTTGGTCPHVLYVLSTSTDCR